MMETMIEHARNASARRRLTACADRTFSRRSRPSGRPKRSAGLALKSLSRSLDEWRLGCQRAPEWSGRAWCIGVGHFLHVRCDSAPYIPCCTMGEPNFEEVDHRGAGTATPTPTPASISAGTTNVHLQQHSITSTAEAADATAGATAAAAKDTNVAGFQHPAVPGSGIGSGSGSHSYDSQGEGAQGSDTQCNSIAAPATNPASYMQNAQLPPLNTTSTALPLHQGSPATAGSSASSTRERHQSHHPRTPSSAGLSLDTNFARLPTSLNPLSPPTPSIIESKVESRSRSNTIPHQISGGGSLKTVLSTSSMASSLSPGSAISSPALGALQDITPLPSPLVGGDSPGPWGRRASIVEAARPHSRHSSIDTPTHSMFPHHGPGGSGAGSPARTKKKGYGGLVSAAVSAQAASTQTPEKAAGAGHERSHSRNRSVSEFVPEALHNVRPRHVTISNVVSQAPAAERVESEPLPSIDTSHLHREEYLAEQRGLTPASASAPSLPTLTPTSVLPATLPTPPASNQSAADSDDDLPLEPSNLDPNAPNIEYLPVRSSPENPPKLWRPVRLLGQGTFSKVILATSQRLRAPDPLDEATLDTHKLVAIKVVEHGPAGGADEERIELSLKREVEMLKSVLHPSLIHLKAFDYNDQHALLVLTYCPGGDLFDLASEHRDLLTPFMVQRIFAELVGAVRYLHKELIVHRDIKLESTHPLLLSFLRLHKLTFPRRPPQRPPLNPNLDTPASAPRPTPNHTHRSRSLPEDPTTARLPLTHHPLRLRRLRRARDPSRSTL